MDTSNPLLRLGCGVAVLALLFVVTWILFGAVGMLVYLGLLVVAGIVYAMVGAGRRPAA